MSTLVHLLIKWSKLTPDKVALHQPLNDGSYRLYRWKDYLDATFKRAQGLLALGIEPKDRIILSGPNCADWVISQLAIMAIDAIPVPIYENSSPSQIKHILKDSGACAALVDKENLIQEFRSLKSSTFKTLITFKSHPHADYSLEALDSQDDDHSIELQKRIEEIDPLSTAFLVYTSGTTGNAKGVMLSHQGLLAVGEGVKRVIQTNDYRLISYLPLSHVAEQASTNLANLQIGGEIYFCDDINRLKDMLLEVRPTLFLGVPRVWEKLEAAIKEKISSASLVKKKLAQWALKEELKHFSSFQKTQKNKKSLSRKLARRLVIDKIKTNLGFDKIILAGCGGAPANVETLKFFASLNILILEIYGMTESSGMISVVRPDDPLLGSVGKAMHGVELKIKDDQEILFRGVNTTLGYWYNTDATQELIDSEGWIHTGDLGYIDSKQNLIITGRKKDIIITAGGKNIAPVELETKLNSLEGISQSMIVGDKKPYLCALLAIDNTTFDTLNKRLSISAQSSTRFSNPHILQFYRNKLDEINASLAKYQRIQKFWLIDELTIENGELTPTLKLKRNVLNKRYEAIIEKLYQTKTS